jgi:hypothetical protein
MKVKESRSRKATSCSVSYVHTLLKCGRLIGLAKLSEIFTY